jgi:hypothetical protein
MEMLNSAESQKDLTGELVQELLSNCKSNQTSLMKMVENAEVTNETLLEKLLVLNDEIMRAVEKYLLPSYCLDYNKDMIHL